MLFTLLPQYENTKDSEIMTQQSDELNGAIQNRKEHWRVLKQLLPQIDVKESNLALPWNHRPGGGLFTSKPFQQGEVVFFEKPSIRLESRIDYVRSEPSPQVVYELFAEKMPGCWNDIVARNYSYGPGVGKGQLLGFYKIMDHMPIDVEERVKMQHGRLLAIWQAHAMYFTHKDKRDVCAFSLFAAYLNQSHDPNVHVEWQFTTRYLVVRARRDIEQGEEILGPWLENALPSRKGQIHDFYKEDGDCHCNECRFRRVSKLANIMEQLRDEDEAKRMAGNDDWQSFVQQLGKSDELRSKTDIASASKLIQKLKDDDKVKLDAHDLNTGMPMEDVIETSFRCLRIMADDDPEMHNPNERYLLWSRILAAKRWLDYVSLHAVQNQVSSGTRKGKEAQR